MYIYMYMCVIINIVFFQPQNRPNSYIDPVYYEVSSFGHLVA
jgi:hypothetical protein